MAADPNSTETLSVRHDGRRYRIERTRRRARTYPGRHPHVGPQVRPRSRTLARADHRHRHHTHPSHAWCSELLDLASRRADSFRRLEVGSYEEAAARGVQLRRVVVICDEIAEIALAGDDQAVSELLRVVQLVRALGIHVILAGQRFGSDLGKKITAVRAQIGGRVCARVNDVETARMVLSALDEEAHRRALTVPRPAPARPSSRPARPGTTPAPPTSAPPSAAPSPPATPTRPSPGPSCSPKTPPPSHPHPSRHAPSASTTKENAMTTPHPPDSEPHPDDEALARELVQRKDDVALDKCGGPAHPR